MQRLVFRYKNINLFNFYSNLIAYSHIKLLKVCVLANLLLCKTYIIHRYCIVADLELPIEDRELWRCADKIVDFWQRVGLQLGLEESAITIIEVNNPGRNEKAALAMLRKWKQVKVNATQRELDQAIETCQVQVNKGN